MKQIWQVVQDLERASHKGVLTPSFIDAYADRHGERVAALYALATKNLLTNEHEAGRNDHVLTEWEGQLDVAAALAALDEQSAETYRLLRVAKEDGRPYALRKPTRHAFYRLDHRV